MGNVMFFEYDKNSPKQHLAKCMLVKAKIENTLFLVDLSHNMKKNDAPKIHYCNSIVTINQN
jgi:hypothetical protein